MVRGFSHIWDIHEVVPPSSQKMLEQDSGEDLALRVGTDPLGFPIPHRETPVPFEPKPRRGLVKGWILNNI